MKRKRAWSWKRAGGGRDGVGGERVGELAIRSSRFQSTPAVLKAKFRPHHS